MGGHNGVTDASPARPQSDPLERSLSATLRTVFPGVWRDPVEPTNTLLMGTTTGARPDRLGAAVPALPAELRPIALEASRRLAPALPGGEVLTDDRAPVEWMIDGSIIDYAAGNR